jgi:hypothetical protein
MLGRMSDEQRLIFEWIGILPVVIPNWEKRLPELYDELNGKWFDGKLPALTDEFVCEFCPMPRNTAGIFIDAETAQAQSTPETKIRPGIRINPALEVLPDHVKIALLHEMVHAGGIKGHKESFDREILRLILAGAYRGLL